MCNSTKSFAEKGNNYDQRARESAPRALGASTGEVIRCVGRTLAAGSVNVIFY